MPLALLPVLLLLLVPIVEITVFILVGDLIGVWPTLGLVVGSAVFGVLLLRRQGLSVLTRIRAETAAGRLPGRELVHGVMILAAGLLLLTPGLVTDAIGYLLFIPPVRDLAWRFLRRRVTVIGRPGGGGRRADPASGAGRDGRRPADVVELGGDDFRRRPDPSSPWNDTEPGGRTLH